MKELSVALAGNPNAGKSSIFNALAWIMALIVFQGGKLLGLG
jgi:Fe2+ transport system protein B